MRAVQMTVNRVGDDCPERLTICNVESRAGGLMAQLPDTPLNSTPYPAWVWPVSRLVFIEKSLVRHSPCLEPALPRAQGGCGSPIDRKGGIDRHCFSLAIRDRVPQRGHLSSGPANPAGAEKRRDRRASALRSLRAEESPSPAPPKRLETPAVERVSPIDSGCYPDHLANFPLFVSCTPRIRVRVRQGESADLSEERRKYEPRVGFVRLGHPLGDRRY